MRYEKPELVLLGEAASVVLGGMPNPVYETDNSSLQAGLLGYEE